MLTNLRRALRKWLAPALRLRFALARRNLADRVTGMAAQMSGLSRTGPAPPGLPELVKVTQPIRASEHFEGKLANLALAAQRLNGIGLPPGKILSFWALMGEPAEKNGFALGRAIRADVLGPDIGGGLCQISGLAYELGLRAGLTIIERHPHSQDLYTEAARFTPLGLDATVVWGHKDLRLRNDGPESFVFGFEVSPAEITGRVWSNGVAQVLRLERVDDTASGVRQVQVWRGAERMSRDDYESPG